jgi:hypothetical protein
MRSDHIPYRQKLLFFGIYRYDDEVGLERSRPEIDPRQKVGKERSETRVK